MKISICLTLYRRPEYTKQVLDALLECYGIEDIPVFISQDWSFEHYHSSEAVQRLAYGFQEKHPNTQYFVNTPKLGIDLNKLFIIPKAFEAGADFVIFIEDDTVPARDLIRFMASMAEEYEGTKEIWSVCGYNNLTAEEFGRAKSDPYMIGLARGFCPWIWGTWRDRWQEFYGDDGECYKGDTKHEANGLFDHWLSKKERVLIVSVVPRCRLIGEFGAEHTTPPDWEREHNEWGAWDLDLPDVSPWPIHAGAAGDIILGVYRSLNPTKLLHAGTSWLQNAAL
jgi:hypothetical protein